jgi:hypothetical protein
MLIRRDKESVVSDLEQGDLLEPHSSEYIEHFNGLSDKKKLAYIEKEIEAITKVVHNMVLDSNEYNFQLTGKRD